MGLMKFPSNWAVQVFFFLNTSIVNKPNNVKQAWTLAYCADILYKLIRNPSHGQFVAGDFISHLFLA